MIWYMGELASSPCYIKASSLTISAPMSSNLYRLPQIDGWWSSAVPGLISGRPLRAVMSWLGGLRQASALERPPELSETCRGHSLMVPICR